MVDNKLLCICAADFDSANDLIAHRQHCEIWQRFMEKQTLLSQHQEASQQLGTTGPQIKTAPNALPCCEICGARSIGWKEGLLLCNQHWNNPVKTEVKNMADEQAENTSVEKTTEEQKKEEQPSAADGA